MFYRRIYYKSDGSLVQWHSNMNIDQIPTRDEDFQLYPSLRDVYDIKDQILCLEWLEPDEDLEAKFAKAVSFRINPET